MSEIFLGISAYYHDSAAAVVVDGEIIAAAQEERFTRKKNDPSFPANAVKYVLDETGIPLEKVTSVVFYDKPFLKFERLLETHHAIAPTGLFGFLKFAPVWIKEKLFLKKLLRKELSRIGKYDGRLLFTEHHLSHAASAFFPSPFKEAAILTLDGTGEWTTTAIGYGKGNNITFLKELHFPHSLGLLYSAFTYYCGFKVNSGEYKLMGLAPYGNPDDEQTIFFYNSILEKILDIRSDGTFLLNMEYFRFLHGNKMCNEKKWKELFGIPPRKPDDETFEKSYLNLAFAIQKITEEIVIKLANTAKNLTGSKNLVMAGGVALNGTANGKLLKAGIFENIWIQPAAGDAGGALGAALSGYYIANDNQRVSDGKSDAMKGALLGPRFTDRQIELAASKYMLHKRYFEDFKELSTLCADMILDGKVAGWFQGRMEFGPRALGNRSIIADASSPEMQKRLNLKIKFREGFRPFAPMVLEEDAHQFFETEKPLPYMLFVVPLKKEIQRSANHDRDELSLYDRLYITRSEIPAVTHVDFSARVQTVDKESNSKLYQLLTAFREKSGRSVLINTSFNVRGEPIVCTPEDAIKCFMKTDIDFLVIGNYIFEKISAD